MTVELMEYLPRGASVREKLEAYSMPVTETACQVWLGSVAGNGYGQMAIAGKKKQVHRLSYEVHIGPIPDGMCVLHRCDTPCCINPDHLFLGTTQDNVDDKMRKGRFVPSTGENNGFAKLTTANVVEIKQALLQSSTKYGDLAAKYGVHKKTIGRIARGERWIHV